MRWCVRVFAACAVLFGLAACSQIEPDAITREDGTIQFCPNPYNRHHVLTAARKFCAPQPAQSIGFEACDDDPLLDGRVFICGYNPGYEQLDIDQVREVLKDPVVLDPSE